MSGLIESIVDDIARAVGQRVTTRISGGGIAGGGGGGTIASAPPLPTQGAPMRSAFERVGEVATTIASLPDTRQAVNFQLATYQTRAMGTGGSIAGVQALQSQLASRGTVTSATDAAIALQQASLIGMGGSNVNTYMRSIAGISNLMPGLGVSGAASAYMSMQNPTNVNMLRTFGINMRNLQTGKPNDINSVVNEIWGFLNRTKAKTGPIDSDDINISLMPGNFLDRFLSQYGGDSSMQQALVQALYAKAGGAKSFSKAELKKFGFTTGAVVGESERFATQQQKMQGTTDSLVAGFEGATNAIKNFTQFMLKFLDNPLVQGFYTTKGFLSTIFKAEGGPTQTNKPYIIGERGPEVFVPETDGYIVPNHHLPDDMRQNLRRMTYSYNKGGGGATGKGKIPRAGGDDIKSWASAFLAGIGAPITDENLKAIGMWAQREGGWSQNSAAYNPLNTTYGMPGSWSMNKVGVKGYQSFEDGVRATIATLTGNRSDERGYTAIVNALKNNSGTLSVLTAVNRSAWVRGEGKFSNYNFSGVRPLWESGGGGGGYIDVPTFSISGGGGTASASSSSGGFLSGTSALSSTPFGGVAAYIESLRARGNFGDLLVNQKATLAGRAAGGRVSAGTAYMVGEMGAEQYVPDGARGGMSHVINYGGVTVKFEIPEGMTDEKLFKKFKELLETDAINKRARGK